VTAKLRLSAGGTALVAGLCFLATSTATPADLSKDAAKKAAAADVAALQKKLEDIAAAPEKNRGAIRTAKALALTLNVYGDDATKGQAAKVLLALHGKDYPGAATAAKGLSSPKADPAALKGMGGKYDLEDIMSPFRVAKSGGLNIEKDIRDSIKAGKIDPKDAELIGARSAALADYTAKMPNDKAKTSPAMTQKWERWAKEMGAAGKELTEAKGDEKKLLVVLKKLDASCSNCHNDFRNE
jgi:hypothetical protein